MLHNLAKIWLSKFALPSNLTAASLSGALPVVRTAISPLPSTMPHNEVGTRFPEGLYALITFTASPSCALPRLMWSPSLFLHSGHLRPLKLYSFFKIQFKTTCIA